MKLARFDSGSGPEIGIVSEGIVPISPSFPDSPRDLMALIAEWSTWRPRLASLPVDAGKLPLDRVHLLAPIPKPGKVLGIGLNYADHIEESGLDVPADQLWFSKAQTSITGPNDPIRLPTVSDQLDYEAELVVVIGSCPRYATEEQARSAIFGFCAGNDVTIRDWQFKTSQFILGKSFDSHAPHGPWIVTADEIDPLELDIACRVNGETRQSSNTRHLIFDPVAQIKYLSQAMTLEPGDLLFTGTPGGVGFGFKPPRWLRDGDLVEVEIGGIGKISNRVVAD